MGRTGLPADDNDDGVNAGFRAAQEAAMRAALPGMSAVLANLRPLAVEAALANLRPVGMEAALASLRPVGLEAALANLHSVGLQAALASLRPVAFEIALAHLNRPMVDAMQAMAMPGLHAALASLNSPALNQLRTVLRSPGVDAVRSSLSSPEWRRAVASVEISDVEDLENDLQSPQMQSLLESLDSASRAELEVSSQVLGSHEVVELVQEDSERIAADPDGWLAEIDAAAERGDIHAQRVRLFIEYLYDSFKLLAARLSPGLVSVERVSAIISMWFLFLIATGVLKDHNPKLYEHVNFLLGTPIGLQNAYLLLRPPTEGQSEARRVKKHKPSKKQRNRRK
jgi:hypothetical protein